MDRRDFLKNSSAGVGLGALSGSGILASQVAQAQSVEPHFFLFAQIRGAWDICLAFDPKDREEKLPDGKKAFDQPYAKNEIITTGGGKVKLAPQGGNILKNYGDKLMIINGIDMRLDSGHRLDSMMTGNPTGRASGIPYFQAKLCKEHKFLKSCIFPHIYTEYDNDFYAAGLSSYTITARTSEIASIFSSTGKGVDGSMQQGRTLLADFITSVNGSSFKKKLGFYNMQMRRSLKLASDPNFSLPAGGNTPDAIGKVLGAMFKSRILGSATLSLGRKYRIDTHSRHYQSHQLVNALDEIHKIVSEFKKIKLNNTTSVFDRTTVIITSEYCRTPRLNRSQGKDHNFRTNSMCVFGHKVKPSQYGESGARKEGARWVSHAGQPIDFKTGKKDANGQKMHPDNVWAGMSNVVGVDCKRMYIGIKPVEFI